MTPDYKNIRYFLEPEQFTRPGTPLTTEEYVTYREVTLQFIAGRGRRMAEWVTEYHPEIEVHCPWWRPRKPGIAEPGAPGAASDPEV